MTDFTKTTQPEVQDFEKTNPVAEKGEEILVEVIQEPNDGLIRIEVVEPESSSRSDTESIDWEPFVQLNEKSRVKSNSTGSAFLCTHCFKSFDTRAKCSYHMKTKHENKQPQNDMKSFTCDRCGTKFKHKSHVINHLNVVHLRIKRYQCNVCGFAMYSKTHHTTHMKTHLNIKEFKCEQCGKDFGRKEALMVHLR